MRTNNDSTIKVPELLEALRCRMVGIDEAIGDARTPDAAARLHMAKARVEELVAELAEDDEVTADAMAIFLIQVAVSGAI
jgi:hypothetical protein